MRMSDMTDKVSIDWNARSSDWANAVLNADRLDELLDALGCDLRRTPGGTAYRGRCPVHGGEHANFRMKIEGHTLPVRWECYSHECHKPFKGSLLGFVRGVLTFQNDGKDAVLTAAERYLKAFLDGRLTAGQRGLHQLPVSLGAAGLPVVPQAPPTGGVVPGVLVVSHPEFINPEQLAEAVGLPHSQDDATA
jgi:hypothetical protein